MERLTSHGGTDYTKVTGTFKQTMLTDYEKLGIRDLLTSQLDEHSIFSLAETITNRQIKVTSLNGDKP